MQASMLLWLVGIVAVGVVLLIWGLRGKRINDHPVCRQCRFDLSGQPDGTVTCPECGAGLKREGFVRIGQRRKRPIAIGVGTLAVLLPVLAIGTILFALITGTDLNNYKPLPLLVWESKRADAAKSKIIGAELHKRMQVKGIAQDSYDRIVQTALEHQGEVTRAWAAEWGDIIEQADTDGKLSKEDQSRYHRQAPVVKFEARPRVTMGEDIPVIATLKEARVGSAASMMAMCVLESANMEGKPTKRGRPRNYYMDESYYGPSFDTGSNLGWFQMYGAGSRMGWAGQSFGEAVMMVRTPSEIDAGNRGLDIKIGVKTLDRNMGTFRWPNSIDKDDPDASFHEASLNVEVLPEDVRSVEVVVPTPEMDSTLTTLLEPSSCIVYVHESDHPPQVSLQFNIDGRPIDFAFQVSIRTPEGEWNLSPLTSGRSAGFTQSRGPGMEKSRHIYAMARGFTAKRADIVLRPSEQVASHTLDITRMYGGEIVIRNVDVRWQTLSSGAVTTPPVKSSWSGLLRLLGL